MTENIIKNDIACLERSKYPATLVSTKGTHCEVWQSLRSVVTATETSYVDFVIKIYRQHCRFAEIKVLHKEYRLLKEQLGSIVPNALFISTPIDQQHSVMVLARTFTPWFNIANPLNESELVPLFRRLTKAQNQLRWFIHCAKEWQAEDKILDLYGVDNLILDKNQQVRYLDSFGVFFYRDLLEWMDDEPLEEKINLSMQRLEYLEYVLKAAEKKAVLVN